MCRTEQAIRDPSDSFQQEKEVDENDTRNLRLTEQTFSISIIDAEEGATSRTAQKSPHHLILQAHIHRASVTKNRKQVSVPPALGANSRH